MLSQEFAAKPTSIHDAVEAAPRSGWFLKKEYSPDPHGPNAIKQADDLVDRSAFSLD